MSRNIERLNKINKDRALAQNKKIDISGQKKLKHKKEKNRKKTNKKKLPKLNIQEGLEQVARHSSLLVEAQNEIVEVSPVHSYKEASALLLGALEYKGIYCLLSWPIGFEWPGLLTALATRALSDSLPEQIKLRSLQYPSSSSVSGRYKRTRIPFADLLAEPNTLLNSGNTSLNERQRVLLSFNDLNGIKDIRKNPSLKELTPIFEWRQSEDKWTKVGGNYLEDVRLLISSQPGERRHSSRQKQILTPFQKNFENPLETKEGMFRLSSSVPPKVVMNIFIKHPVDIAMLDVREQMVKRQSKLPKLSVRIAEKYAKDPSLPSLFVLFDDLSRMINFTSSLKSKYKEVSKKERSSLKPIDERYWLRSEESFYDVGRTYSVTLPETTSLLISNAEDLHGLKRLNSFAKDAASNGQSELASAIRIAAGFLRRIVDLPVGQVRLKQWLDLVSEGRSEEEATRRSSIYLWSTYFRIWRSIYSELLNPWIIEKIEKVADGLVNTIQDRTNIEIKLTELLLDLVVENKKTLVLINEGAIAPIIEQIITKDIDKSALKLVKIETFKTIKGYEEYDALIIAGFSKVNYRHLFKASEALPETCFLLSGAYSATQVYHDFLRLLEINEFSAIHPAIKKLVKEMEGPVKSFERLGIPLTLPPGYSDIIVSSYERDYHGEPYAIIHLQGHVSVDVFENSKTLMRRVDKPGMPYESVSPHELEEGDYLLVMDDHFADLIEVLLDLKASSKSDQAQNSIRLYLNLAQGFLKNNYTQPTRTRRARAILRKMHNLDPEGSLGVTENMVVRWIKSIEEFSLDNEQISSNSARDKSHFILFTQALSIDENLAEIVWRSGIQAVRVTNIQTGREFNKNIRQILCGSVAPGFFDLDHAGYESLVQIAHENTYMVDMITLIEQEGKGEPINA